MNILCDNAVKGNEYVAINGDCVSVARQMKADSVDFSIYSPPFASIFTYSASELDMGNCADDAEFTEHYQFLVNEMFRIHKPGTLTAVHCSDLPMTKWKDGEIGLKDFMGDIVRAHQAAGWVLHSRVTIWRDPVVEMTRTKALGLLYKQVIKDSSRSRVGMPDYLCVFRKPGERAEPVGHDRNDFPVEQWQKLASPVWMDIRQTRTLNAGSETGVALPKSGEEEKHICLARGSMVLTKAGYIPIETVRPGDEVLTHLGRWRRVTVARCTGVRPVITIKAQGVPGLTLTPDHKIWLRKSDWVRETDGARQAKPDWVEAQHSLRGYVNLKLPQTVESEDDPLKWWIVGRWIGDGHFGSRGCVYISCGDHEIEKLKAFLGRFAGSISHSGTSYQIRINDPKGDLRDILADCGHGAAFKRIPGAAFSLPVSLAKELLDGYLSADGHFLPERNRWMASTVSRELALGLSFLAQRAYGAISSVYAGRPARDAVIDGRSVKCKQDWIFCFDVPSSERYNGMPFILEDGAWKKVRSITDAGEQETWCLRVEEDESFTAEGCIVKNCPLQLDVIENALFLWSNKGDVVFSPFMGVGSEGAMSLKHGRKFIGTELKDTYWKQSCKHLEAYAATAQDLFAAAS